MPQPKPGFKEVSYEVAVEVLDFISSSSNRNHVWFGEDLPKGQLVAHLAWLTSYDRSYLYNVIKTLEVYHMVEVRRLSHDFPCQHNFIIGLKRLGRAQWLAEPDYMWGSVQPRPMETPGVRKPRMTLVVKNGRRIA
jgi:hypothetical protein